MNISFIGAGKVGTSFGLYIKRKNINVVGYFSENIEDSKNASFRTDSQTYQNLNSLVCDSNIILITTNDDNIKTVKDKLLNEVNINLKNKIVVHMSGSYSSDILKELKEYGCHVYSMHPLQSFSDIDTSVDKLQTTVFSIEGKKDKIGILEDLLDRTKNKHFQIDTDNKELYHISACIVSNYLVTLIDLGLDFLKQIGISEQDGLDAIMPLIDGTIDNIKQSGTKNALTGPIARGDIDTIKSHLTSIEINAPDNLLFYKLMALKTLDISSNSDSKVQEMKDILNLNK